VDVSGKIRTAESAEGEELWGAIKLQHPDVMMGATMNRRLTEDMALFIVKSRSAPPEALGALAGDVRFKDSYKIKLALCRNPRTPQRVALAQLKFIKLFDLADLTRDRRIPVALRQKVEFMLTEKIPSLAQGIKSALSRRACSTLVVKIMEKGNRNVINACLDSPLLTEEHLYGLLLRPAVKPLVVRVIAEHPKWSLRYSLRFGLIRNTHTPMEHVGPFICGMKSLDLKNLYSDPRVPSVSKPFIFRELRERSETVELPEDVVYELPEGEETRLPEPPEIFGSSGPEEVLGSDPETEDPTQQ
jgi:hypothetical protein